MGGSEVVAYHSAQECMQTILTARFNNQPLPQSVILVDLDLGEGMSGPEMIRRLRQFIPRNDLTFILMNGRSAYEDKIASDNLLDIRTLYREQSVIMQEMSRVSIPGGQE